jgi:hypothetical protein
MAGSQTLRLRGGRFAVVLALSFFTIAGRARAQYPPPLAGTPAPGFAQLVDDESTPESIAGPLTGPEPFCNFDPNSAPPDTQVEMGLFDTITESICGKPDPNTWCPLPCSTLFSEGWNEAWVPSPNGSGGAPRQGWINAIDGNMYRLGFLTFAQGFNNPPAGNASLGAFTLLTPFSRRLMLITNIPYAQRNAGSTGLPFNSPAQSMDPATQGDSTFGDISFTPRVLLHETQDFSLTTELAVVTPTGNQPLAGKASLIPAVGFWNNFSGGWVIRGGFGVSIPTNSSGNSLISQFAIGQTVTGHDVPLFGDFTYYVSAVVNTPLSNGGGQTSVALTPGLRTHLGRDWYFLAALPIPLTEQRVADLGLIVWFMKAW